MTVRDLLVTIKEINEKKDKCIYLLNIGDITVGCSWKNDVDNYLLSKDCPIGPHDDLENVTLVHGWVLDPAALPVEIPRSTMIEDNSRSLWLFIEEEPGCINMDMLVDVNEVAEEIEKYMAADSDLSIENFAVVVGDEMDLALCVSTTGKTIVEKDVYEDA